MTVEHMHMLDIQGQLEKLQNTIRKHRDSWLNGDDKCWKDNEDLYKLLPEGFEIPERDELVELELCKKYIASCHHPETQYVSPQRRIEELEAEVENLNLQLMSHQTREPYEIGYINGGNACCKKIAADIPKILNGECLSNHISGLELAQAYKTLEEILAAQNQIIANQREALKGRTERP